MPRHYAVDSSQQSTSMSAYSVPRSIPPTQGTVPTLIYYPNTPSLNPEKLGLILNLLCLFSYSICARITTKLGFGSTVLDPARGGKYRFEGANRNRGKELRDAYSDAYRASRLRTSQRAASAKRDVRVVGKDLLQGVELNPQPKGRAGAILAGSPGPIEVWPDTRLPYCKL